MHIDWWTLGLQTVNLLVLVWILARFLFRPIARIIAERQAQAEKVLADAALARSQAEDAKRAVRQAGEEAAATRSQLIEEATREADNAKATLLASALQEADRLRDEARQQIARMHDAETKKNEERASRLAVDIAARLFEHLPDEARVAGFIDGLAQGLARLADPARDALGTDGGAVTLKVARALSTAEEKAVHAAFAKVLGRDLGFAVKVDPDLIAGLELETPHIAIRNSFRDDLDRIAAELTRDQTG